MEKLGDTFNRIPLELGANRLDKGDPRLISIICRHLERSTGPAHFPRAWCKVHCQCKQQPRRRHVLTSRHETIHNQDNSQT